MKAAPPPDLGGRVRKMPLSGTEASERPLVEEIYLPIREIGPS